MTSAISDLEFDERRPRLRTDAVIEQVGNEAVAWHAACTTPTHLDPIAALCAPFFDGSVAVGELVADVHAAIGVPEAIARARIRQVVSQLDAAGLTLGSSNASAGDQPDPMFMGPVNH